MEKRKKYIYHSDKNITQEIIEQKKKSGWELCGPPEGVTGRDLSNESVSTGGIYWFRKEENDLV